ncbi:MAG: hypothetical protein ACR2P0_07030 [Acidimicrobiales bacterium]
MRRFGRQVECYLCGASNPADADFCTRCSGQLLKIGLESPEPPPIPETDPDSVEIDGQESDSPEPIETHVGAASRHQSLRSVEHRRLGAALGLSNGDDAAESFADTSSVATARPSAEIPVIGTRPSAYAGMPASDNEPGRLTYILLILLALSVGWLGWTAVRHEPVDVSVPDGIAFATTTIPPATTTTTTPPRTWTDSEVGGTFGTAFLDVTLFTCPAFDAESEEVGVEPIGEWVVEGVAIGPHTVLLDATSTRGASIAEIRGRRGSRALALLSDDESGALVATTDADITRNLELQSDPRGSDAYYVSRNDSTGETVVSEWPSMASLEVIVTDQGDSSGVRVRRERFGSPALIARTAERIVRIEIEDAKAPTSACDNVRFLEPAAPTEADTK